MKFALIGDVHAHNRLDEVLRLLSDETWDLCFLPGDLGVDVWRGDRAPHDASVRSTLKKVEEALACPVLFVPGNHDMPDPPKNNYAINIDGLLVKPCGLNVLGLGGAGPEFFGFPYEWTEEEAARILGPFVPPVDIFLCHSPPKNTMVDRTLSGEHVGSTAVRAAIERLKPRLFLCGHIHEACGVDRLFVGTDLPSPVPCLNAGALGQPYGQVIAWRIVWEDGPVCAEMLLGNRRSSEPVVVRL